jgi:hypothetical protein
MLQTGFPGERWRSAIAANEPAGLLEPIHPHRVVEDHRHAEPFMRQSERHRPTGHLSDDLGRGSPHRRLGRSQAS